ncbi:hypothetical protein [Microbispora sp. NPDC046933]|uniref:hypothetical protein n=1 Tax=Microbispora sp. NPDC046933 TaxID=3155618 RepID=UPI0033CE664C
MPSTPSSCAGRAAPGSCTARGGCSTAWSRRSSTCTDLHAASWTSADSYEMRGDARRFENREGYVAGKNNTEDELDRLCEALPSA